MSDDAPVALSFPCAYPIKVVVRAETGVRDCVDEIVARHAGPLAAMEVSERPSAQHRFLSITYVIRATGEAQIAALFQALKRCPPVVLVL
jgi:putative lipoic acid-binding regulatory protein